MANQLGGNYTCVKCGTKVSVTNGGNGTLICDGQPMKLNWSNPNPSSHQHDVIIEERGM